MTPFLLAAGIAGTSFFLTLARYPSHTKRVRESPSPLQVLHFPLWMVFAIVIGFSITSLLEYILFDYHAPYVLHGTDQFVMILQSRVFWQSCWGAAFGMIFGYWTHTVVVRAHLKKLAEEGTKSLFMWDLLVWITLLLIFLAAVLDGVNLGKIAGTIGNVKLPGGVELSLGSKQDHPADASFAQIVPPVNPQAATYAAPNASSGLGNLSDLSEAARRDGLFLALKMRMASPEGEQSHLKSPKNCTDGDNRYEPICLLGKQIDFAERIYEKIGSCFKQHVLIYQDDTSAAETLMPMARFFSVMLLHGRMNSFVSEENLRSTLTGVLGNCYGMTGKGHYDVSDSGILSFMDDVRNKMSPYHWNAPAAIFAYGRRYPAAINVLNVWLMSYGLESISNTGAHRLEKSLIQVYELRVRSLIAGYIYEWLNREPNVKTKALLDYHADNLRKAIDNLEESLIEILSRWHEIKANKVSVSKVCETSNFLQEYKWDSRVSEQLKPRSDRYDGPRELSVWRMTLSFISTLISLKQTWIDVALSSDDYQKSFMFIAQKYADELHEMDMSCMKAINPDDGVNYANVLKAESLYWYARVARANALTSEHEGRKERLQDALLAAREGLALVATQASQQRAERLRQDNSGASCIHLLFTRDNHISPSDKNCPNAFAYKISGTEEIREFERLSEIIRQLNADLD